MNDKKYLFIGSAALILGLFLLGVKYTRDSQKEQLSAIKENKSEVFVRAHSPRLGNPQAKVTLVEFLDPECESCRMFFPYVKNLLKEYEEKVQLVLRYAAFHGNSKEVIKALESSKKQGKYWESLEILFATQPKWGSHHHPQVELIYEYLPNVGVDISKLKEDMKDPGLDSIIEQDTADLKELGVKGTPTFFVNGRSPESFSFDALQKLLREEVSKHYP